jgi:molybdopterin synthase sulfur carrier subunit
VTAYIPSPLRSYTAQKGEVDAQGATLGEALSALDQRYPGLRFRIITEQDTIRQHIRIFVNEEQARDLSVALRPDDEIHIICALSGG